MDDNNENYAQGSVIHSPVLWNIPDLPFGIICSFLDTSTLMNLCLVCKKFNSYIKNETPWREWKRRAKHIWSDAAYPILSPANDDKVFWRMSCEALQKQKTLWTQKAHPLVKIAQKGYRRKTRYHRVSSLLLMHDGTAYIVAKSYYLFYNNIESEHSKIWKKATYCKPITDLTILNNEIYSCSSENKPIKSWKLNNGHLQMETSYNFDSGPSRDWPNCLTSCPGQDVFAVGSLNGFVSVFDSRSKNPMYQYKVRRGEGYQIYTLAINSEYILSASYDNIVSVYDQRNRRIIQETEIPEAVTCMKMQQDCVLIGDHVGKLHVLNPKNDFDLVKSYDIGHTRRITGIHLTYGSLITSSTNEVIISSPTDPPKHMYTFNIPSVRKMDYQSGTLALFNDYDQVLIYRPVQ